MEPEAPKEDQNWFDGMLKRFIPNGTVMRRYVFFTSACAVILVALMIIRGEQLDNNTNKIARSNCFVVVYAEQQADNIALQSNKLPPKEADEAGARADELDKLGSNMRTLVNCPPRHPRPVLKESP